MKENYDVIIAGAGPAGGMLAFELAGKGIDVLVLEKDVLPRYKCCAGGVTFRAAEFLNGAIEEVKKNTVTNVTVRCKNDNYSGYSESDLIYTFMREDFDYALIRMAEKKGATVLQGQKVTGVMHNNGLVEITTGQGSYRARYLAGADGAYSLVARSSGVNVIKDHIAAVNADVKVSDHELGQWRSRIHIDVGCIAGGYGWVFPKKDVLSIGIGCISSRAKTIKKDFDNFITSLGLKEYTISRFSGGLIPVCKKNAVVYKNRVLLLGDAAGFVDPLTGEGIFYAMKSAKLAAPVIEKSLHQGVNYLDEYQRAVEKEILPEINWAWTFQKLYMRLQSKIIPILRVDESIWNGCCSMVRGDLDYSTVVKRVGGFKVISGFLTKFLR
jgi:geranylgeranyl reductase family protein